MTGTRTPDGNSARRPPGPRPLSNTTTSTAPSCSSAVPVRMTREGAILGMITGIQSTAAYMVYFKFVNPTANTAEHWWLGISPEGIGTVSMRLNVAVALTVERCHRIWVIAG